MTRQKLTIGVVAAAFTLSLAPAVWAQAGSRPNTTGSSSGSAAPRGGGGSSSSGGSSSAGSSSSSGSSSSPSVGERRGSSGSSSNSERVRERAPQRPSERAVRRGSSSSDRGSARATASRPSGSDSVTRGRSRADVPAYSRPRENRNVTGTAVERRDAIGNGNSGGTIYLPGIYYPYDPFYSHYYGSYYSRYGYYPYSRYWVPGYGFGLGYFAYDPLMFGGYDYYGGGYGGGGYSSGGYSSDYDLGNLRLKVKPNEAQVYVDGYFVGPVDSFDGIFQKLGIEAGAHRIELRAEGYETVQFEVLITPGETVTYQGEMKPIRP